MEFPIAALAVKRNFYMDDLFKSVKSTDEAMEMQQQLSEMLYLGGFHLTKWISNEKEVIVQISEPERAPSVKVVDENIIIPVERALGVVWDTSSDCFVFEVVKRNIAETRRHCTSLYFYLTYFRCRSTSAFRCHLYIAQPALSNKCMYVCMYVEPDSITL